MRTDLHTSGSTAPLFSRLLREPLLHFLLIGALVFAVYGQRPASPVAAAGTIEITPEQVDRLAGQFEAVWRRPPTAEETAALVEGFVREEVYYREALALGLDRDDTVIRRRLHLKMEFIGDAAAEAMTPDDTALQAFLDENSDPFLSPGRVSFRQVFLGDDDPAATLALLRAGAGPAELGRGGLLPETMDDAVATTVDGTFGAGFFAAISALEPGAWQGPIPSAYGPHLVRLDDFAPATTPALADIRDVVEGEWRQREAERLREASYQALRARYDVILPEPETPG